MNLSKIVFNQLKITETVIIPDLGAFITEAIPARLDEKRDTIHPPSKELIFNKDIKNNDGVLVQAAANEMNISEFDATNRIKERVDDIIYALDKDKQYDFEDLGVLYRDETDGLTFYPKDNLFLNSAAYGLSSQEINLEKTDKETKVAPVVTEEKEIAKTEKSAPKVIVDKDDSFNEQREKSNKKAKVIPVTNKNEPVEEKKEKKRRGLWWLWLLLLLLLIGFLVWYFQLRDRNPGVTKSEDKIETVAPVTTTTEEPLKEEVEVENDENAILTDDLQEDKNYEKVTDVDLPPYTKPLANKYYLVNGSFKEKKNAIEHYNKMKDKGFDTKYIGVYNDFYMISIADYDSERKSVMGKNYLYDKYPYMNFWVYSNELLEEY